MGAPFFRPLQPPEVPQSPVAAGMVGTTLPSPGARGFRIAGKWANLPVNLLVGGSTVTGQLDLPVAGAPITLGVHTVAPAQAPVSGFGGKPYMDVLRLDPLYDPSTQRTGYAGDALSYGYGYGW